MLKVRVIFIQKSNILSHGSHVIQYSRNDTFASRVLWFCCEHFLEALRRDHRVHIVSQSLVPFLPVSMSLTFTFTFTLSLSVCIPLLLQVLYLSWAQLNRNAKLTYLLAYRGKRPTRKGPTSCCLKCHSKYMNEDI